MLRTSEEAETVSRNKKSELLGRPISFSITCRESDEVSTSTTDERTEEITVCVKEQVITRSRYSGSSACLHIAATSSSDVNRATWFKFGNKDNHLLYHFFTIRYQTVIIIYHKYGNIKNIFSGLWITSGMISRPRLNVFSSTRFMRSEKIPRASW